MGFFGGKKNKTPDVSAEQAAQDAAAARKSRRVVVPGQKAGAGSPTTTRVSNSAVQTPAPAVPQAPAAKAPSGNTQRVGKPTQGAQSGQRPVAPAAKSDSGRAPKADDGLMLGGPSFSSEPTASPTPARPKSREPIVESAPLAFAGDIASGSRHGPVRTGDNALIEFLVKKANPPLLTADQAAHARNKAVQDGVALDVAAVQLGFINEEQLVSALTQECWVPHLKVDKYEIRKKALDTISRDDAVHFGVFPVDKLGSLLTMAMVNPLDQETIRSLEGKTGLDIKKVVATRSEINQGIEKYYSGTVVAKDTSLSFTQDVEPKSVTQMLTNVPVTKTDAYSATKSSSPASSSSAPLPVTKSHTNVVPEIQDIDDLLSSDEVIAPSIIEPIGIEPISSVAEEIPVGDLEPLSVSPGEIDSVEADPFGDADPFAQATAPAAKAKATDLDVDLSLNDTAPIEPVKPAAKAPVGLTAPEFLDDALAVTPAVKPASKPAPAAARPAPVSKGGAAAVQIVNLMPVMEEEFQHAITHGKAHVFEKWVGLQTRNRIINGTAVEPELEAVLAGLYACPRA